MKRDPYFQHMFFASSAQIVDMASHIAETYIKKETLLLVHITLHTISKFNVNNLVNEINLVHNLFLLCLVNLYKFRTSPDPSSGGTTVFV